MGELNGSILFDDHRAALNHSGSTIPLFDDVLEDYIGLLECLINGSEEPEKILNSLSSYVQMYGPKITPYFQSIHFQALFNYLEIPCFQCRAIDLLRLIVPLTIDFCNYLTEIDAIRIIVHYLSGETSAIVKESLLNLLLSVISLYVKVEDESNNNFLEEEEKQTELESILTSCKIIEALRPFCTPENTCTLDICIKIFKNIFKYSVFHSSILSILIPLASEKRISLIEIIDLIICILNSDYDSTSIQNFIFQEKFLNFIVSLFDEDYYGFKCIAIKFFEQVAIMGPEYFDILHQYSIIEKCGDLIFNPNEEIYNKAASFFHSLLISADEVAQEIVDVIYSLNIPEFIREAPFKHKRELILILLRAVPIMPPSDPGSLLNEYTLNSIADISDADRDVRFVFTLVVSTLLKMETSEDYKDILSNIILDHDLDVNIEFPV